MRNGCNYCSQLLANHGAANYLSLPEPAQIPEVRVAMASNCSDFSPAKGTELLQLHVGSLQKREYSQTSKKIALKVWFMLGEGGGGGGSARKSCKSKEKQPQQQKASSRGAKRETMIIKVSKSGQQS